MSQVVSRVRALLIATTTLGIAVAAHVLAGGSLPLTLTGWLVPAALTAPVAVWTARRRLTLPRLLPAMAVLQVLQHTTLGLLAGAGSASGSGGEHTSGHGLHELAPGALAGSVSAVGHLHHGATPRFAALMLAAHALAVVVTGLLLATGDRAAAFLVVWFGAVALMVRSAHVGVTVAGRALPAVTPVRALRPWDGLDGLRLRGPPATARA